MLSKELKEILIQESVREVNPKYIVLYGPFAKGTEHKQSDIDLTYFSNQKLSNYDRFILASKLSNLVEREVDLIDIREIDTVFTMQVFSEGIPIYTADENEFIRQRIRAYRFPFLFIQLAFNVFTKRQTLNGFVFSLHTFFG